MWFINFCLKKIHKDSVFGHLNLTFAGLDLVEICYGAPPEMQHFLRDLPVTHSRKCVWTGFNKKIKMIQQVFSWAHSWIVTAHSLSHKFWDLRGPIRESLGLKPPTQEKRRIHREVSHLWTQEEGGRDPLLLNIKRSQAIGKPSLKWPGWSLKIL